MKLLLVVAISLFCFNSFSVELKNDSFPNREDQIDQIRALYSVMKAQGLNLTQAKLYVYEGRPGPFNMNRLYYGAQYLYYSIKDVALVHGVIPVKMSFVANGNRYTCNSVSLSINMSEELVYMALLQECDQPIPGFVHRSVDEKGFDMHLDYYQAPDPVCDVGNPDVVDCQFE